MTLITANQHDKDKVRELAGLTEIKTIGLQSLAHHLDSQFGKTRHDYKWQVLTYNIFLSNSALRVDW